MKRKIVALLLAVCMIAPTGTYALAAEDPAAQADAIETFVDAGETAAEEATDTEQAETAEEEPVSGEQPEGQEEEPVTEESGGQEAAQPAAVEEETETDGQEEQAKEETAEDAVSEDSEKQEEETDEKAEADTPEENAEANEGNTDKQPDGLVEENAAEDDSNEAKEAAAYKGKCGKNITWEIKFNDNRPAVLYIEGDGDMYDYDSSGDKVPGYMKYKDKIGYICVRGTVRYIGSNAFFGMPQVESIELQSDLPVTIGKRAFMNCRSIKNFDMYNDHKIEEIGPEAFRGCTSLWDVDLSGTQAKRIGDYAFYGCKNLRYVDLESCWDTIGKYAFASCPKLARVELSRYIVEIGTGAFEKSNGRPLIIYDGLRSEWTSIFHGKMRDFPDEYKAGFYKGADGLKHYSDEYGKDVTGTARINGKIYVFDKNGAASLASLDLINSVPDVPQFSEAP